MSTASQSPATKAAAFKGFDDLVEIFAAGTHVDSSGKRRTWTTADLDAIVANHSAAAPAPIVVGHPAIDAPAYGWTGGGLSRVADRLYAKFTDVEPQFAQLVAEKRFPNRSVKIADGPAGPKLVHVGFLGAAPPAIEGLKPIEFAADDSASAAVYEFSQSSAYGMQLIASGMRRMREFFIEKFGLEAADRVTPDYSITGLEQLAADAAKDDSSASGVAAGRAPSAAFAAASSSVDPEPHVSQEQLDAATAAVAVEKARADAAEAKLAQFSAAERLTKSQSLIAAHVAAGRLLPAQAEGLAEFRASIDDGATFEFAAADGTKTPKSRVAQFDALLDALPVQIESGIHSGADTAVGAAGSDPAAIAAKAAEYVAEQAKAGVTISIAEAVNHVSRAG